MFFTTTAHLKFFSVIVTNSIIKYDQPLSPGSKLYSSMTHEVSRKKTLSETSFNKEKAHNVVVRFITEAVVTSVVSWIYRVGSGYQDKVGCYWMMMWERHWEGSTHTLEETSTGHYWSKTSSEPSLNKIKGNNLIFTIYFDLV